MKTMKKLFALLLAVIMVMAMGTTAFAAEPGTGSITINNATIHEKYAGYKIFDATVSGDNIAYTIKESNQFYVKIIDSDSPFELARIGDTDTFTVAVKEGKSDQDVLDFVKTLVVAAIPDLPEETATGTQVKWDDVPYGYYFITSSIGATVSVTNADSNVTIVDKNLKPGWIEPQNGGNNPQPGKNVSNTSNGPFNEDATATQGENVYYSITAFAPKYNGDKIVNEYVFADQPDPELKLDQSSFVVAVNDMPLGSSDYTLTYQENPGCFEIRISVYNNDSYPENATITITYCAEVAGTFSGIRENKATMTWTEFTPMSDDPTKPENPSNPETPSDDFPDPSVTLTYVYGFELQKYKNSAEAGNELDGAEFKLYDDSDNEIQLIKHPDGYYTIPDSTQKSENPVYVNIEAGKVKVCGLKEGTYYLEEIKAPDGYNPLTSRVKVTVGRTLDSDYDGIIDEAVKVINNTGVMLPETGGIGTTIFYVVGGLLMAGAVILLITKKKMSASND